jgi:RIO kinase 1
MTVKELFDFITDPTITDNNRDAYLDKMSEKAAARTLEEVTAQEQIDEEVFKKAFIPKRLTEVCKIVYKYKCPYFLNVPFNLCVEINRVTS